MNNFLNQKSPIEISKAISEKIKQRRKKMKISQSALAKKSGVSLGSIKRFESKYEIALISLIKIAIALEYESDFKTPDFKKLQNIIFST